VVGEAKPKWPPLSARPDREQHPGETSHDANSRDRLPDRRG
jgi:hypothetical protein